MSSSTRHGWVHAGNLHKGNTNRHGKEEPRESLGMRVTKVELSAPNNLRLKTLQEAIA